MPSSTSVDPSGLRTDVPHTLAVVAVTPTITWRIQRNAADGVHQSLGRADVFDGPASTTASDPAVLVGSVSWVVMIGTLPQSPGPWQA